MTRLLTPPPTAPWIIRRVTDRAELEQVFRLRYRVIVQELGDPAPADTLFRRLALGEVAA